MPQTTQSEICEVLPPFKPIAVFLLIVVAAGYVWTGVSYPHETITDYVMPALMWSFVAVPIYIVSLKMGTGVCIQSDKIEYVGIFSRRRSYAWQDVKRIRLSAGRSKLRYIYIEFNNKSRVLFSNRQKGFWRAAKKVVSVAESQNVFLAYELGDKGRYWMWDGEEGAPTIL